MPRWLLPENISDILPLEARRVEELRRALLDLYRGYGYELVIPPLIEYLDSLLTGTGSDLDLRMFKLTDQASGRHAGLAGRRDAAGRAHRCAHPEPQGRGTALLRRQRAARTAAASAGLARAVAGRRRALRTGRARGRRRGDRTRGGIAAAGRARRPSTWTSAIPASCARCSTSLRRRRPWSTTCWPR